jgi:antitoxin component YwqK of YwqJK toxin-antitoxin module
VGKWTIWYENGNKKLESNYANDKLNGDYFEWDINGNLVNHKVFSNDKLVSKE